MRNRRKFSRAPYEHPIVLTIGRRRVRGVIRNISLGGAYVAVAGLRHVPLPRQLGYEIALAGAGRAVRIKGRAEPVWADRTGGGLGMLFVRMAAADFTRLRRLVELSFGDADLIDGEMKHYADTDRLARSPAAGKARTAKPGRTKR